MKVIAIDIDSSRAIIYSAERISDNIATIEDECSTITIIDDTDSIELRRFKESICNIFKNINPSVIGIIKRANKGKFSASSVSFKIEAIIQCYDKSEIIIVSPLTLNAFYKKNEFYLKNKNKYQLNSARLAQYLLSK